MITIIIALHQTDFNRIHLIGLEHTFCVFAFVLWGFLEWKQLLFARLFFLLKKENKRNKLHSHIYPKFITTLTNQPTLVFFSHISDITKRIDRSSICYSPLSSVIFCSDAWCDRHHAITASFAVENLFLVFALFSALLFLLTWLRKWKMKIFAFVSVLPVFFTVCHW